MRTAHLEMKIGGATIRRKETAKVIIAQEDKKGKLKQGLFWSVQPAPKTRRVGKSSIQEDGAERGPLPDGTASRS